MMLFASTSALLLLAPRALSFSAASRSALVRSPAPLRLLSGGASKGVVQRMTAAELSSLLKKESHAQTHRDTQTDSSAEGLQVVDVRETHELSLAKIRDYDSGAVQMVHLPLSEASQWAQDVIDGERLDKHRPTVVLCHHGVRSMRVANFLVHEAGFDSVYNLDGGIHAFAQEVDASVGFF